MDMLVHLLDLPAEEPGLTALAQAGIRIRRGHGPGQAAGGGLGEGALRPQRRGECDVCFATRP